MSSPSKNTKKSEPIPPKPALSNETGKQKSEKDKVPQAKVQQLEPTSKQVIPHVKETEQVVLTDNKKLNKSSPSPVTNLLNNQNLTVLDKKPLSPIEASEKSPSRPLSNSLNQTPPRSISRTIFHSTEIPSISTFRPSRSPSKAKVQLKVVKEADSPKKVIQKQMTYKTNLSSDEIEAKIKARRRVLEILEDQTPFISDEHFLQIQSRDLLIEELTKEVIEIKSTIKQKKMEHEEVIRLKTLSQRVSDLEKEKSILMQEYDDLNELRKVDQMNFVNEKEESEKLLESFNEENLLLRTQIKSKNEENEAMLDDIKKLSDIVKQFKNINGDLNEKIEKMNQDIEALKVKYYETDVKAASIGELEASLNDYIRIYKNSQIREETARENVKMITIAYEDLEGFIKFVAEQFTNICENLTEDFPEANLLKELKNRITNRKFLNIEKKLLKEPKNKNFNKKEKIVEMGEKLEKNERELRILENQQKPLLDQIQGLKELAEVNKKDHKNSLERVTLTLKTLQDYNDSLTSEIQTLRVELGRKEGKVSTLSSKIINLENLQSKSDEKFKKVLESKTIFEKENIDLKEKLKSSSKQLSEKSAEVKKISSQNLTLTSNVQALHEEFWKKDNIILKNKRAIAKLEKTLADLNKVRLEMPKAEESSERLLKELYERDQKIEVLKDMLKSMKVKEKQKNREVGADISAELYPERFEKSEKELLNSLVAKILNKFFGICSVNKSSTDSSPDIPRLIKKLRQDLRMYTVFSTRDLQLSVAMLQHPLSDCKSHLNLEELIVIVSKAAYAL